MDITVGYCEPWDTALITSKRHFIERAAADDHRILYLEAPYSLVHLIYALFSTKKDFPRLGLRKVENNIWVGAGITIFPYSRRFSILDNVIVNTLNQFFYFFIIKFFFRRLNFKVDLAIIYLPFVSPILSYLNFKKIIFHVIDNWDAFEGLPKTMSSLSENISKSASVTVVSGLMLYEKFVKISSNCVLIDHGTDVDLFQNSSSSGSKSSILKDISDESRPLVLYYGALHKLNLSLIKYVAASRPSYDFVFIGPRSGGQGVKNGFLKARNIHVLDAVPRAELPAVIAEADVFWMPFLDNEVTRYMSPIKLIEALSAGCAVVSTDLPECKRLGGSHINLASTNEEHLLGLDFEIDNDSVQMRADRSRAVKSYDWDSIYQRFINLV